MWAATSQQDNWDPDGMTHKTKGIYCLTLCKKNSPSPGLLCSPLTQNTTRHGYEKRPKAQVKRNPKTRKINNYPPAVPTLGA